MAKVNKKDTPFEELSEEERDAYIEKIKREMRTGSNSNDDKVEDIIVTF